MSHFAKRHYEAVALAIQEAKREFEEGSDERHGIFTLQQHLEDTFARDNSMFKRGRFANACLPGANVRARS